MYIYAKAIYKSFTNSLQFIKFLEKALNILYNTIRGEKEMNQILVTEKVIVTPEFKRKKKIYKFNFFLSVFLICTLFSCYIYAEYDRTKSEEVSQEILLGLKEEDDTNQEKTDNTTVSVDNDVLVVALADTPSETTTEISLSELIQDDKPAQPTIVESTASDGTKYYTESIIRIPSLDIEYPVLSNTSEALLKISINKLWGPAPNEVGNYVVVGHNYKSGRMFGKLSEISIGDEVELEDLSGRTITYKVYDKYIVEPTDVSCTSQLTNGKKEITLITCHGTGNQRLIVKAIEAEEYDNENAMSNNTNLD